MVEMVIALVAALIIKILFLLLLLLIFNGGTIIRIQISLLEQFMFIKGNVGSLVSLNASPLLITLGYYCQETTTTILTIIMSYTQWALLPRYFAKHLIDL